MLMPLRWYRLPPAPPIALATDDVVDDGTGLDHPRHGVLSEREFDILRLIGAGLAVSQIAVQISLGVKTVSTYRRRVLDKMGMHNNAQLTHYAVKHQPVG